MQEVHSRQCMRSVRVTRSTLDSYGAHSMHDVDITHSSMQGMLRSGDCAGTAQHVGGEGSGNPQIVSAGASRRSAVPYLKYALG